MTKPIDLIHASALDVTDPRLNETCHLIDPYQQHLLRSITKNGPRHFINVLATNVIGVLKAHPKDSSLGAAALCLDGEGCEKADIEYLEQPLRVRPMPVAPDARYSLKLTSYADAVTLHEWRPSSRCWHCLAAATTGIGSAALGRDLCHA